MMIWKNRKKRDEPSGTAPQKKSFVERASRSRGDRMAGQVMQPASGMLAVLGMVGCSEQSKGGGRVALVGELACGVAAD